MTVTVMVTSSQTMTVTVNGDLLADNDRDCDGDPPRRQ